MSNLKQAASIDYKHGIAELKAHDSHPVNKDQIFDFKLLKPLKRIAESSRNAINAAANYTKLSLGDEALILADDLGSSI